MTAAALKSGRKDRIWAAAPETCGQAIEVPLSMVVAVSDCTQAPMMLDPGAKMSTQEPSLENPERSSDDVVEPTVTAASAEAGE